MDLQRSEAGGFLVIKNHLLFVVHISVFLVIISFILVYRSSVVTSLMPGEAVQKYVQLCVSVMNSTECDICILHQEGWYFGGARGSSSEAYSGATFYLSTVSYC